MIEKMSHVCIVTQAERKKEMLDALRELGILHIAQRKEADPALAERFNTLSKLSLELKDYSAGKPSEVLSDEAFEALFSRTKETLAQKAALNEQRTAAALELEKLRPWGNFDPAVVRQLQEHGIDLHFYRLEKKVLAELETREDVSFFRLVPVDKQPAVAVLGTLPPEITAAEFPLPAKSCSQLAEESAQCGEKIARCDEVLQEAAGYLQSYADQLLKTQNDAEYSSVSATAEEEDGLLWLTGYLPTADREKFVAAAGENHWAYALQEVAEDDGVVPTKVRYTRISGLMQPVFDILGTVPGYQEYDISFWFFSFFTLFFAMIIGDAGYGLIFLLGTIGITVKMKKVTNATLLLYVLSVATVVWGSLTGTWFGAEAAMKIPLLRSLVIPGFANYPEYFGLTAAEAQNNVMKFCFSIGVIQLALACIMNIRRKLNKKDLSWLSDLGWLMAICALYFLVLFLVVGQSANLTAVAAVVIAGFLLVVLFGGMAPGKTFSQGLKAGLGDAFTVFLNTISAFGNVMSYIRLFAVGMASLAIAQSFNNMGSGFHGVLVVLGVLVIILGHALNIVMGFLSVAVHGVRLNLLEFSGQLGMEWSGIAYDPFRKRDKIKK